jgi:peptidyl-prolyl cis-trans isomerase C
MRRSVFVLALLSAQAGFAADRNDMSAVLATRGEVKLTIEDMDTILQKAAPGDRGAIVANGDRVQQLIDSELLAKQLAQHGRGLGLTEDPIIKRRLARAVEQELAAITVDYVMAHAKTQDFTALAKESYVANPEKFQRPPTSLVQHILIGKTGRTAEEMKALASDVLAKAKAPGADFVALVMQYSDDPSKADNKGEMSVSQPGQFVPAFETAAQALRAPGEISGLVETEYGLHILRLVKRDPASRMAFDEVKTELIATLETEYREKVRAKLFSDMRSANPVFDAEVIRTMGVIYGADKLVIPPGANSAPLAPSAKGQ